MKELLIFERIQCFMKRVVIYGAGCFSEIFYYEACMFGAIEIAAFTVDRAYLVSAEFCGLPVVPFEEVKETFPPEAYDMMVVTSPKRVRTRKEMYLKAKALGYALPNYISPRAIVEPGVQMGDNNIIFSDAFIGHHSVLGSDNIIRQKVYLGHESEVGDHNVLVAGCTLGGFSRIGSLSFFGLGMVGRDRVKYGEEAFVGLGSVVTKDVEDYATVIGSPARAVSYHPDSGIVF